MELLELFAVDMNASPLRLSSELRFVQQPGLRQRVWLSQKAERREVDVGEERRSANLVHVRHSRIEATTTRPRRTAASVPAWHVPRAAPAFTDEIAMISEATYTFAGSPRDNPTWPT